MTTPQTKEEEKKYHQPDCRGCRGLYLTGDCLSGHCTCIPKGELAMSPQTKEEDWEAGWNKIIDKLLPPDIDMFMTDMDSRGIKQRMTDFIKQTLTKQKEQMVKKIRALKVDSSLRVDMGTIDEIITLIQNQ